MKKLLTFLCAFFLLFGIAGFAGAVGIPFQIEGSKLSVDWDKGGGIVSYTDYSMPTAIDLDQGDYFDFTFGQIFVPLAIGRGTAEVAVDFSSPDPNVTPSGTGAFRVFSIFLISGGDLIFNGPETFGYSYMGTPGGSLVLDFNDLKGVQLGSWVDITGRVTNRTSPPAVPEPSTMLLLGFGLFGLAGVGRKKIFKK